MSTIYIICLEPIDQRYTKQWYTNIPNILEQRIQEQGLDYQVVTIEGETVPDNTTAGALTFYRIPVHARGPVA